MRARNTDLMVLVRSWIVVAALALVGTAQARLLTTKPVYTLTIHVRITDTRVTLDRHSAPRGVQARFVIENAGLRAHTFTLNGKGSTPGFNRTLKPHAQDVVKRFLDYRGKATYVANPGRPGMRGLFVIN
jgi:hypothetical protein